MQVTVCIPTYKRPDLLIETVKSCLNQDHPPTRIIIGDDSPDDQTERAIAILQSHSIRTVIDYIHHSPSLGQTENVQFLFEQVRTELLVLLHDDDLLMPKALSAMAAEFAGGEIDACYGKQYQMSDGGTLEIDVSERVNSFYLKSAKHVSLQLSPVEVALSQQFPNDGYMISSELAKRAGYRYAGSGDACDFFFSLALGFLGCRSRYIDVYTAAYRRTLIAVSNSGSDAAYVMFQLVRELDYQPTTSVNYQAVMLDRQVAPAIAYATRTGKLSQAIALYFGRWHRQYLFTPGGIKRGLLLGALFVVTVVGRFRRKEVAVVSTEQPDAHG